MTTRNRGIRDWGTIVAAILSLGGSLYVYSASNDRQNTADIATLKAQHLSDKDEIDHIRDQVDRLVQELLERNNVR